MKLMLMILWLFALLLTPCVGFAQDTPEVTEEPFTAQAEVLFPAAILFVADVERTPADLERVVLVITADDNEPIRVDVPISSADLQDDNSTKEPAEALESSRLAYVWAIPEDDPPRLFSEVIAQWEISTTNGETLRVETTFTYQDERFDWAHYVGRQGLWTLTISSTFAASEIRALVSELETATLIFNRETGENLTYNVILYTQFENPGCEVQPDGALTSTARRLGFETQVECTQALVDTLYDQSGVTPLHRTDNTPFRQFLLTWMFDQVYPPLWRGKDVPGWFQFALLRYFLPESESGLVAPLVSVARADNLIPLTEMSTPPTESNARRLWESQSYAMLAYMIDQVGREGLLRLSTMQDAASFNEAYQAIIGQPITVLVRNVGRWLVSNRAEGAFSSNPYQADTPTPQPTQPPSVTPIPPTTAPTLPPTMTPTQRPITPTLPPTVTPTRTPTPALPTNTPRPPGSLDTPTPAVTNGTNNSILSPSVMQSLIVSALILLIGIAIFVYIRLGRKV